MEYFTGRENVLLGLSACQLFEGDLLMFKISLSYEASFW